MGSSGAFALYIGRDRLLGPKATSVNGMKCTDVNLVTIRKNNHVWLRKYITSDATDGLTRVRTALRVAKAVYDAQKPELVQVVVLDKNGPTLQSDMRGRALGADVVYVPHPDKVVTGSIDAPITARYYDGGASDQGLFYGERVDMTTQDIDHAIGSMNDYSDCGDPVTTEAAKAPDAGKHTKKPSAEDAGAKAENGAEKAPEGETPPVQHPPAAADVKPESGSTGSFPSVSADVPKAAAPLMDANAAPPAAGSDAAAARALADPQTTGASQ